MSATLLRYIDCDSIDSFGRCASGDRCPHAGSTSAYGWPAAFVRDPDGTVRKLCGDCTRDATKPDPIFTVTLPDGRVVPGDPSTGGPLWLADGGWYD